MENNNSNFNSQLEKLSKELNQISSVPKKEVDHHGNLFDKDEIDPSKLVENAKKMKEAEAAAMVYPKERTKIERQQERRELERQKQIILEEDRKKKNANFKKTIAKILIFTTLASATAYAVTKAVPKIQDRQKINQEVDDLTAKCREILMNYGLGIVVNGEFKINTNSVSDYAALNVNNPMEVFIYQKAIDNNEEFNKFIRSVTYTDGEAVYCYESFEQFLRINGYYELTKDDNGNTISSESSQVFYNMMENAILEAYKSNTLSSYEDEFYSFDLDSQNKTR